MIDTENVGCDTCTAPGAPVLDASTPQSRAWPRVGIETNPYKVQFPLLPLNKGQNLAIKRVSFLHRKIAKRHREVLHQKNFRNTSRHCVSSRALICMSTKSPLCSGKPFL